MCSKKWAILHFFMASSKFHGKRRVPWRSVKIAHHRILLAMVMMVYDVVHVDDY